MTSSQIDDKLSLFQHNNSLFEAMHPADLSHEIQTWKVTREYHKVLFKFFNLFLLCQAMNLARSITVVLGWFLISLRPSTDLLYKHLKRLGSNDKSTRGNKIEIVKMA